MKRANRLRVAPLSSSSSSEEEDTQFVKIGPGENVDVIVPLQQIYAFDNASRGSEFICTWHGTLYVLNSEKRAQHVQMETDVQRVTITSNTLDTLYASPDMHLPSPQEIVERAEGERVQERAANWPTSEIPKSCLSLDQTKVMSALSAVKSSIHIITSNLGSPSKLSSGFSTWFGEYTSQTPSLFEAWQSLSTFFTSSSVEFYVSCGGVQCSPNTFAYVYGAYQYNVIYMCDFGLSRPTGWTARDSMPGIFIHEASHLSMATSGLTTKDYDYGWTSVKALPASQAQRNADNYEYFAENQMGVN
eukprot:CAMPEP_0201553130 /NCGR_PEP_ID=MMETSP0173_2-20130828/19459_1 /ASSEMBLY_ACC=CAM_ASM_000268 /TAXON_ID=218659 /ORGANISM="Vexillifera sp., Strain DIVA3 564/2" /LENGTH=302 /DNA_ID=CAMNT_0047963747 /DNA_START=303 /DNA_END=1211 /DNA_ORIENTATION=-